MAPTTDFVPDSRLICTPDSANAENSTAVGVHVFGAHVTVVNTESVPHVVVPLPEQPTLQVTLTDWPVEPVMEPVAALFEKAT